MGIPSFSSKEKTTELREGVEIEAENMFAKEARLEGRIKSAWGPSLFKGSLFLTKLSPFHSKIESQLLSLLPLWATINSSIPSLFKSANFISTIDSSFSGAYCQSDIWFPS